MPPKGEGLDPHAQVAIGVIVPVAVLFGCLAGFMWYINRMRRQERDLEFEDASGRERKRPKSGMNFLRGGGSGREAIPDQPKDLEEADGVEVQRKDFVELDGNNVSEKVPVELEDGKKVVELRDTGMPEMPDRGKVELRGSTTNVSAKSRSEENLPSKPKRRALVPPVDWTIPRSTAQELPTRGDSLPQSPTTIRNDSAVEATMARLESRDPELTPKTPPKLAIDTTNLDEEQQQQQLPKVLKRNTNPFRKSLQPPLVRSSAIKSPPSKRATSSRYSRENRFSDVSNLNAEEQEGVFHEVGFRVSCESEGTFDIDLDSPVSQLPDTNGRASLIGPPMSAPPIGPPPRVPEKSMERLSGAQWMKRLSADDTKGWEVDGNGQGDEGDENGENFPRAKLRQPRSA